MEGGTCGNYHTYKLPAELVACRSCYWEMCLRNTFRAYQAQVESRGRRERILLTRQVLAHR